MGEKVLSLEEIAALGDAIAETAAIIDVATHRFLRQLREFDQVDGWHRAGAQSCAHWLAWRVGMDLGAAREKVRVARRLAELPVLDGALARGEVSYSKVRAMTRVATSDNEHDLLGLARNTTGSQLEKICRMKRTVKRLGRRAAREQEECRRYVMQRSTNDGMVSLQIRLHPEEAARLFRAIQVMAEGNLADGAVALADLALASGSARTHADSMHASSDHEAPAPQSEETAAAVPEDVTTSDSSAAGGGRTRRTNRPPVEVVVHITAADLQGATELGDGISAETSRRLLCDAGVVAMLEDERGRTIDVGRKTRTISAALRRALERRDEGCRFPSCTNRRFVDGHHIVHWIDGGETSLANTLLICRRHHRYLHECGFTVERDGDDFVFRDPAGAIIEAHPGRPALGADIAQFVNGWLEFPLASAATRWREAPPWTGERVDYERCLAAID